jgi:hypothetical protein
MSLLPVVEHWIVGRDYRLLAEEFLYCIKSKVKFTLEHAMEAQRGTKHIDLLLFNLGAKCGGGGGGQSHAPGTSPRETKPVPIAQVAGWAPGAILTGAENLAPTWIRSSDRPTRR